MQNPSPHLSHLIKNLADYPSSTPYINLTVQLSVFKQPSTRDYPSYLPTTLHHPTSAIPPPIHTPITHHPSIIQLKSTKRGSRLRRLRIPLSNQLPYNKVLLQESLLPPLEILQLIGIQVLEVVKRALQILGEHLQVEALVGETARGIPAGEVLVWAALEQN